MWEYRELVDRSFGWDSRGVMGDVQRNNFARNEIEFNARKEAPDGNEGFRKLDKQAPESEHPRHMECSLSAKGNCFYFVIFSPMDCAWVNSSR